MVMPEPQEPVDFMAMIQEFGAKLQASIAPALKEHLVSAQEDPATRFATVVGGEVMIDFDKLTTAVMTMTPPI